MPDKTQTAKRGNQPVTEKTNIKVNLSAIPSKIPCCPDIQKDDTCDIIDYRRSLTFPTSVEIEHGKERETVSVEVILHFRLKRCTTALTLGDPFHTISLLPGEKVKLVTTDRRSTFTFDNSTKLAYHSDQIAEEQYYLSAFRAFNFDSALISKNPNEASKQGAWDFNGDASGSYFAIGTDSISHVGGLHNSDSILDYINQHKAFASSANYRAVEATKKAFSLSIGDVASRTHKEGESEDHFESSTREFSNPNRCQGITYTFYRLNKKLTIKFTLESIETRVIDPVAPNELISNPYSSYSRLDVIPQGVLANSVNPLSVVVKQNTNKQEPTKVEDKKGEKNLPILKLLPLLAHPTISSANRNKALQEINNKLIAAKILDNSKNISASFQQRIEFEDTSSLPTPGIIVKGCLDDCNICEPMLIEKYQLENKLLQKQIDLLEKSQEYRCCPVSLTPFEIIKVAMENKDNSAR